MASVQAAASESSGGDGGVDVTGPSRPRSRNHRALSSSEEDGDESNTQVMVEDSNEDEDYDAAVALESCHVKAETEDDDSMASPPRKRLRLLPITPAGEERKKGQKPGVSTEHSATLATVTASRSPAKSNAAQALQLHMRDEANSPIRSSTTLLASGLPPVVGLNPSLNSGSQSRSIKTWDAVLEEFPYIHEQIPRGALGNAALAFLADQPAVDGALALSKKRVYGGSAVVFQINGNKASRLQNLKAAMAQAAGIESPTPCQKCERGNGLWQKCTLAPWKGSYDVLAGSCASCSYNNHGSKCSHAVVYRAANPNSRNNSSSGPAVIGASDLAQAIELQTAWNVVRDALPLVRSLYAKTLPFNPRGRDVSLSRTRSRCTAADEAAASNAAADPATVKQEGDSENFFPGEDSPLENSLSEVVSPGNNAQEGLSDMPNRSYNVQLEQPSGNTPDATTSKKLEKNVIIPQLDGHSKWDLEIADGKVVSRVLSTTMSPPSLLLPSLCHPHIHIDKPYILNCNRPPSINHPDYDDLAPQSGSFQEALTNTSAAKARYMPEDLYLRGSQLLAESCGRHGVTAARTFVEVDHVVQFKALETAIQLKRDFEHLIEIQICLFAQDPIFSTEHGDENRRLLLEAIDRFSDDIGALGTTPYVEQGADAGKKARAEIRNIEWAIDTAIDNGLHLDFHLDYNLDQTKQSSVFKIISRLRDYDWLSNAQPGKTIVIGHCTQLTTRTDELDRLRALITEAPELPIHFVGLPTSDLFMMGRPNLQQNDGGAGYMPHARPRGTMQIPSMIKDFGLNGCLGVNNVGNAFTPYGNGDPLQLACWGTGIYQAGAVGDPELLYECVSVRARRAIGLATREDEAEGDVTVPLPGLLIRNFENIELPGNGGGKLTVPARQRLSIRDVVWDPPDTNLRDILR